MEIKRTTEIIVETKRRFVVRQPETAEQFFCPHCDEAMLAAEQAATLLATNCRDIYKIVETGAAHFIEAETGAVIICLASLAAILETGAKQLPAGTDK